MPEDTLDPNYCDVNVRLNISNLRSFHMHLLPQAMLQNDFEVGFYLKERVIPKAVIFFTGEIADCQSSSGSETESEDTEDESDAEEEDGVDK